MRTTSRIVALGCATALAAAPRAAADAPPTAVTDAEFVTKAASGGTFEVLASKMATEKATKAETKAFAEKMIADHSKANDELKAVAGKAGLAVPGTLAAHHEKLLADLKAAKDFDAAYWAAQLTAHAEAVELYSAAGNGVKDAGLRAFAAKTLPVLKTHHEHAKKHAGAGTSSQR